MTDVFLSFAPVIGLLAFVTVWTRLGWRVPVFVYPVFAVLGLVLTGVLYGWLAAAFSAAGAVVLFVMLVGVAASRVSGVAVFSLSASVAALPWWYWWSLAAGLGVALVVSAAHIRRAGGAGRVTFLTVETMQAFGVSPTGAVMKPNLDRIPFAEKPSEDSQMDVAEVTEESEAPESAPVASPSPQIRVPEFLLGGAIVGVVATLTIGSLALFR